MTCGGEITRLDASGGGVIDSLDGDSSGGIIRLECCPTVQPQPQQLARLWKLTRKDLLSTVPIPFGTASFSTYGSFSIAGPPKPGENARLAGGVVVQPPPGPSVPPVSAPVPPSGSSD